MAYIATPILKAESHKIDSGYTYFGYKFTTRNTINGCTTKLVGLAHPKANQTFTSKDSEKEIREELGSKG